jgi:hypothetical protein
MRNPFKAGTPEAFFWKHAGYSYNPTAGETPEQGRKACAVALATAERAGSDAGLSFSWDIDRDGDSSDFSDESPAWSLWYCLCRDSDGAVVASLGAVDFGRDGEPWGSDYRRVVEAELASEATSKIGGAS